MTNNSYEHIEESLRTLGKRANLSYVKKQAIRDKVFQMVGQVELADAIIEGKQKASLLVSLKSLKKALLPDKITFSVPVTALMMVLVFASSVVTGALAQGASPTDKLFSVKKVLESIELAFISNPVSKAKVTLNIADERMRHLETSTTSGDDLVKVLRESQLALTNAKSALSKVSTEDKEGESDAQAEELLDKFSALLNDQKNILNSIEKESENDDVKKAVVAIRETLKEDESSNAPEGTEQLNNTSAIAVKPTSDNMATPIYNQLPDGRYNNLIVRITTAYGEPAVYVSGKYYLVGNSPIALKKYVGSDNLVIVADIVGDEIVIYQITVDGQVFGAVPSLQNNNSNQNQTSEEETVPTN